MLLAITSTKGSEMSLESDGSCEINHCLNSNNMENNVADVDE